MGKVKGPERGILSLILFKIASACWQYKPEWLLVIFIIVSKLSRPALSNRIFCDVLRFSVFALFSMLAISHLWLMSTMSVASVIVEL